MRRGLIVIEAKGVARMQPLLPSALQPDDIALIHVRRQQDAELKRMRITFLKQAVSPVPRRGIPPPIWNAQKENRLCEPIHRRRN